MHPILVRILKQGIPVAVILAVAVRVGVVAVAFNL